MSNKKSARIVHGENFFYVNPKQFWNWVRDGIIDFVGEHPLIGKFKGNDEAFLITNQHTVLNVSCSEHLDSVLTVRQQIRKSMGRG